MPENRGCGRESAGTDRLVTHIPTATVDDPTGAALHPVCTAFGASCSTRPSSYQVRSSAARVSHAGCSIVGQMSICPVRRAYLGRNRPSTITASGFHTRRRIWSRKAHLWPITPNRRNGVAMM